MPTHPSRGFTPIELVLVIIVLGIQAVTAQPRFINIQGDALKSSVSTTAGSAAQLANAGWAVRRGSRWPSLILAAWGSRISTSTTVSGRWAPRRIRGQGPDTIFPGDDSDQLSVSSRDDCESLLGRLLHTDQTAADELHRDSDSDHVSRRIPADDQSAGNLRHDNCRYTLRDSIGRFPAYSDGLGFDYNSVTGAVTRNFQ